MSVDKDSDLRDDDVTRLVREGRRPEDLAGRARLAVDKLRGAAPLGIDAPNKTVRKMIGGAGSLLVILKYGFFGVVATGLGALLMWAGSAGNFDLKTVAVGAGLFAVGIFALWRAARAYRIFRAIARA